MGTAINRLKDSEAKSKVIILLTDGVNNDGFVDPRSVAEVAKKLGIKVYTIGIGTNGLADYPRYRDPNTGRIYYQKVPVEIDEKLMREIAATTGGKYFRATDENKLKEIYKEIDSLGKEQSGTDQVLQLRRDVPLLAVGCPAALRAGDRPARHALQRNRIIRER